MKRDESRQSACHGHRKGGAATVCACAYPRVYPASNACPRKGLGLGAAAALAFFALGALLVFARQAQADEEVRWSFTFQLGAHVTPMEDLNQGLYKSPLLGNAIILVREGGQNVGGEGEVIDQNETEVMDFRFDNPLPDERAATLGGAEFAWHPNDRHAFFIGVGSWERTSANLVSGNLPLQQFNVSNVVNNERIATISFTEYNLGWRYNFFRRPRFRIYSTLAVHEVFDIDYRERWVFLFVESPIQDLVGVRRDMVVEAQTASLFMGAAGLGMEWFLRDWLSLGVEGRYLAGKDDFTLRYVKERDDFNPNDQIFRNGMPYMELSDGRLGYLKPGTTPQDVEDPENRESFYERLRLNFDGWRVMFRVSLYY